MASGKETFSFKKRIQSFGYAFRGLRDLFIYEHNAWIHLIAAVCAVALGFVFKISVSEWIALCVVIGFVFSMEIVNSAIEKLADAVDSQKNEKIRLVKDLSAAAVLVSAIISVIVGLLIFLPKI
ncbi:MAG: diacylglycerol kinase family protein [Flavobacteriales bacterium]